MKNIIDNLAVEVNYLTAKLPYRMGGRRLTRRIVLVNGPTKTGTTWMWRMLASLPGHEATDNFKGDHQRYLTVQPGSVIHGHEWPKPAFLQILRERNIDVILMVRDPRDQVVSRMHHLRRDAAHPWHPTISEMALDEALNLMITGSKATDDRPLLPGIDAWLSFIEGWQSAGFPVTAVRYEQLLADTENHLAQALSELEIEAGPRLVRSIVARYRFERMTVGRRFWKSGRRRGQEKRNSHFRKGIKGDWKNVFKEHHRKLFAEIAGERLVALGYEPFADQ